LAFQRGAFAAWCSRNAKPAMLDSKKTPTTQHIERH